MPNLDLKSLFDGLCEHIRHELPAWPGVGHMWTSTEKGYFFCKAVPKGLRAWLEVPVEHGRSKPRLDLVWASACPDTGQDDLVLALESEGTKWNGTLNGWKRSVLPELAKLLQANSEASVLVASRERPKEPNDLTDAFKALDDEVMSSMHPAKCLLLVIFTPPQNAEKRGCVAHGVVYGKHGGKTTLKPANCW